MKILIKIKVEAHFLDEIPPLVKLRDLVVSGGDKLVGVDELAGNWEDFLIDRGYPVQIGTLEVVVTKRKR